jgi:hypothetical protein
VRQPHQIDLPPAIGLGLDDLQPGARRGFLDAELLGGLGERHAVDDRFRQPVLGGRQPVLPGEPADRRPLHLIGIEDHHQHGARPELG